MFIDCPISIALNDRFAHVLLVMIIILAHIVSSCQINLSEYRNRARKPADRKPSTEATPTLPSHIIHYPTIPPQPVAIETGMNLSPIAMTTCVPMTSMVPGVPVTTVGGLPQFEPVSPDDIDNTPSLLPMEGECHYPPLSPLSSPLSPHSLPFFPTIPHSLPFFPTIPHSLPCRSWWWCPDSTDGWTTDG